MIFFERRWPVVSSTVVMLRSLESSVSGGQPGWGPHVHGLRLTRRLNSPLLTGWMSPKPRQSMARPPRVAAALGPRLKDPDACLRWEFMRGASDTCV